MKHPTVLLQFSARGKAARYVGHIGQRHDRTRFCDLRQCRGRRKRCLAYLPSLNHVCERRRAEDYPNQRERRGSP